MNVRAKKIIRDWINEGNFPAPSRFVTLAQYNENLIEAIEELVENVEEPMLDAIRKVRNIALTCQEQGDVINPQGILNATKDWPFKEEQNGN